MSKALKEKTICYHCGDDCPDEPIPYQEKQFCCQGCRSVYALLSQHEMGRYYSIEKQPGIAVKNRNKSRFAYLDDEDVASKIISYRDHNIARLTFSIPAIHCSSCVWLLENLYRLNQGVRNSRVNFMKREATIVFDPSRVSLRALVELLASIGYEPALNLNNVAGEKKRMIDNMLLYKIGVAGFCFGNIMLISFPEYFGLDTFSKGYFSKLFGYLNLLLSVPVFVYSGSDYLVGSWKSLRKKQITIDTPLALGLIVLFFRSAYEILSHSGIGYCDTLAGLVFFLLIGKWFQQKTYDNLSFERDYKSYFPISVSVLNEQEETSVSIDKLKVGDRILIRSQEIIPADSILLKGEAKIDFSFVSGEKEPLGKVLGEIVYAGGKQTAGTLELEVCKPVSQSYLTQLWNNDVFVKPAESRMQSFQSVVSRYFTMVLLAVAVSAFMFWMVYDQAKAIHAFTSVLIIACPCALALSSPFALGNAMRLLGRVHFFVKSADVVERIASINTIVFDKTGTITQSRGSSMDYEGKTLSSAERDLIYSITRSSIHPLSRRIHTWLSTGTLLQVADYREESGRGISARVGNHHVALGSAAFVGWQLDETENPLVTHVYVCIDEEIKGKFVFNHAYREGLHQVLSRLALRFQLHLLSGDNDKERSFLRTLFPPSSTLLFRQSPADKLLFVDQLRMNGEKVMMVGDGLNDAGALKAADIGVSVSENTSHFSPSSDVIMGAKDFERLPVFIDFCRKTLTIIHLSFVISLIYNVAGLSFAVSGNLSPVVAAILMPISSVSVIAVTTLSTHIAANRLFKKHKSELK